MDSHPKKKGDQRLRILRELLSLSQRELSEVSGVSLDTLRSIEIGRRKLTDDILNEVSDATGGKWNIEAGLWEFAFKPHDMTGVIPLTRELYREFRRVITTPPSEQDKARFKNILSWKLMFLLDYISDTLWYSLFLRLEKDLETLLTKFEIKGQVRVSEDVYVDLGEFFSKTRLGFVVAFNPETGKIHQFTPVIADMLPPTGAGSKKKSVKRAG
jgi:transcriptional regulator with XRE-family HTH domain